MHQQIESYLGEIWDKCIQHHVEAGVSNVLMSYQLQDDCLKFYPLTNQELLDLPNIQKSAPEALKKELAEGNYDLGIFVSLEYHDGMAFNNFMINPERGDFIDVLTVEVPRLLRSQQAGASKAELN